jgi:hypothetical protein
MRPDHITICFFGQQATVKDCSSGGRWVTWADRMIACRTSALVPTATSSSGGSFIVFTLSGLP